MKIEQIHPVSMIDTGKNRKNSIKINLIEKSIKSFA